MNTIIAPRRNGSRVHGLAAAGGVLLGLASSGLAAQASTIALDPLATAVYTTEYHARAGGGVALDQETTHSGSSSSTHQSITSIGSVGSANFDLGVIGKPLPGVTVSVASSGSAYASASGEVTYQFRIETLSGLPNQIVPVTISFKGDQSVSPVNANLYNQTDASVSIEGAGYKESYSVEGGHYPGASHWLDGTHDDSFTGTSFDVSNQRNLVADTLYSVDLFAVATSDYPNGTVSASVDPYIMIAVGYTGNYRLVFSPGIGNGSSIAATPLPGAFPLFVSAMGGLGFLGYRRRRGLAPQSLLLHYKFEPKNVTKPSLLRRSANSASERKKYWVSRQI